MRVFIFVITSLILLTINVNNHAGHIDKTALGLELLYNYFYDSGYYRYICDSLNNIISKPGFDSAAAGQIPNSIGDFFYESWLAFEEGTPYVRTRIYGKVTPDELHSLGVILAPKMYEYYEGRFKLRQLPEIALSESIDSISYNSAGALRRNREKYRGGDTVSPRSGSFGHIAGRILCCDENHKTASSIFIYRLIDSLYNRYPRVIKRDPAFGSIGTVSDPHSEMFTTMELPPAYYELEIHPHRVLVSGRPPIRDTGGVTIEEVGLNLCEMIRVCCIRVAPDSISVVNIKLPFRFEGIDPYLEPYITGWDGDIAPISL